MSANLLFSAGVNIVPVTPGASINIGAEAQARISELIGRGGGWVWLQGGECGGWARVPSFRTGQQQWWGGASIPPLTIPRDLACALAVQIEASKVSPMIQVVRNGDWQSEIQLHKTWKLPKARRPLLNAISAAIFGF